MPTTNRLYEYSVPLLLFVAAVLTAGSYFLPVAPGTVHETATHWRMVSTVAMFTLMTCGGVLFLRGVSSFKAELKRAYRWFSVGLILFALSFLQLPFLVLLGAENGFWVQSGAMVVPFIVSALLMYKGMRLFALLLKVQTRLTSWRLMLSAVVGLMLAGGIGAYLLLTTISPTDIPDEMYMYSATVAWSFGFGLLAWLLSKRVRKVIGVSYQQPMTWLEMALGALTLSGLHELVTSVFVSENNWYLYSGAISWPFIVTGLLFVVAGHKFDAETIREAATLKKTPVDDGTDIDRAYIDSIINVAQLASQPRDVDPILDGLRRVTANVKSDTPLSDAERQELLDVYQRLEEYLLQADPLKTFTVEQLRPMLAPEFRELVEGSRLRVA